MKLRSIIAGALLLGTAALPASGLYAQSFRLGDIFSGSKGTGPGASSLSSSEIASGLKEALTIGAQNASNKLSATNGFFGNPLVKIMLPEEVRRVETALRNVGMGSLVDDAILKLNRAAEDASRQAAPIFVNAITSMSITDAVGILRGADNAATQYLERTTTTSLTNAFRPTINNSLNKVGAVTAWNKVFTAYNRLPMIQKVNPDLTGYVTSKALQGLFLTIAQEESKIRKDPAAQVTNLLKKVFGNKQ